MPAQSRIEIPAPAKIHIPISAEIGTIANSPGRIRSAKKVPKIIVTQIKTRRGSKGTQLFITAPIVIRISRKYITVWLCSTENGEKRLIPMIITVIVRPKGAAWERAVGRNFPRILRISDWNIVKNDG